MIQVLKNAYALHTPGTSYVFRVTETGHLEHLYYGPALGPVTEGDISAMEEKRVFEAGNMISYDESHPYVTPEDLRLEMSASGKGDIREPFLEIVHADGSRTSDFLFEAGEVQNDKPPFETLPGSLPGDGCGHLCLRLRDAQYDLRLELHYYVFEDCDVISRSACLFNESREAVTVLRLMSLQLDLEDAGYAVTSFTGAWSREMNRNTVQVPAGKYTISSAAGTSSNRANPFFMLHRPKTSERHGNCYAFNLIYSGNHVETSEVNAFGKTRILTGINPRGFSWQLNPGERLEAPEAFMTFSGSGFSEISRHMHDFIQKHIVRGFWRDRVRPVLLNSWEACYFNIDENRLLRLAKSGREAGIELLVMDDGWFGNRNDDSSSLGDWAVNRKKLPGGLDGICRKVNVLGMDFGIWVEPEMISTDSELYRSHPDWAMEIPGHPHSEGRHQRILDLANPEVTDHMTEVMTGVFASANIRYVKWDMNRIFSDVYSPYLPPERQGETAHRYICGLYRMLEKLTSRFPEILFEGCASGGNRFDPGMLCYFPQIWASDNTDALCRAGIQEGYSYGYPMSVISAHVSSVPNHQTLRITPPETRFAVAAFGVLGYECNLADMNKAKLEVIRSQIALYKEWREVLQRGRFYRGRTHGNIHEWICVSEDKRYAVGMLLQELARPNTQFEKFRAAGLDPDRRYRFYNLSRRYDIRKFGDLINTAAPVHVKQDSVLHNMIARFVSLPGETEEYTVSGAVLMRSGVSLSQGFSGTGYNEQTRYFQDFSSRLYFCEAVEETADRQNNQTTT